MSNCIVMPPGLQNIPPFPAVAARLLALLSNPGAEIGGAAELIGSDTTLTAHVLKRVNSYDYALKTPVTDIRRAVALLGLDTTREITTTIATATYVKRLLSAELLRCWHHSVATAVLSEEIAKSCGIFANIAFVAGILHDIGRLGLFVAYPNEYRSLLRDAEKQYVDLLDAEEQKFGLSHTDAGRLLAEAWKLPEEFRIVSGRHHDSCDGSELDLLWIIHHCLSSRRQLGFCGHLSPK